MQPGEWIDRRYNIRELRGEGGMGQVFKAWDRDTQQDVAIKALLPEYVRNPDLLNELRKELLTSRQLSHPHIVSVYDFRPKGGYIVMEFIDGMSLDAFIRLQAGRRVEPRRFIEMARQILSAVSYAHERGVIHRDLKPPNILVAKDGRVKIADFGIAARVNERSQNKVVWVSLPYVSPEQLGNAAASVAMDIYSLGCVFYHMLSGLPPFHAGDFLEQHRNVRPRSLTGVPPGLNAIVMRCLEKIPSKRYPTADELALALAGITTRRLALGGAVRLPSLRLPRLKIPRVQLPKIPFHRLAIPRLRLPARQAAAPPTAVSAAAEAEPADLRTVRLLPAEAPSSVEPPPPPEPHIEERVSTSQKRLAIGSVLTLGMLAAVALYAGRSWETGVAPSAGGGGTGGGSIGIGVKKANPDPGSVSSTPEPAQATLVLSLTPWAKVDSLVRTSDGRQFAADGLVTPCVIAVPPGDYHLRASNPNVHGSLELDLKVGPGELKEVRRSLPGFDVDQEIQKIFK
jgi:serine/threonine protein kinase